MADTLSNYRLKTIKDEQRMAKRRLRLAHERIAALESFLRDGLICESERDRSMWVAAVRSYLFGSDVADATTLEDGDSLDTDNGDDEDDVPQNDEEQLN